MPLGRQRFPSLPALRAFEAVARTGSHAAAARELGVTDAAVRQHVRTLEDHFGRTLFARRGRTLEATEEATRLAETATSAFRTLQAGVDEMYGVTASDRLRITLPPAFAEHWLMPRLEGLWLTHPEMEIELSPSLRVTDLRVQGFDLAIRYGHGEWPGYRSELLASARYSVVAAPALAATVIDNEFRTLAERVWLFENSRTEHRHWAEQHGLDFDAPRHRHYPTNSLVLSAARAGQGLILQAHALVARDIERGDLVELYSEDAGSLAYYIVTREVRSGRVETLARWLKSSA